MSHDIAALRAFPGEKQPDVDLRGDAAEAASQPPVTLEQLVKLGNELEELLAEQGSLNEQLSYLGEKIQQLQNREIPEALSQLGLSLFKLSDGTTVERVEVVTASVGDANRAAAHQWLRENGHGDLIKNEVIITFGKGEDADAKFLLAELDRLREEHSLSCGAIDQKERVHPSTLNAQVRQWLRDGVALPLETFKVYVGQAAKLKRPKGDL